MLKARNIVRNYGNLPVLKGIDLDIHQGELVTIVGASGAGKSTLLQIVGTLDRPDGGQVWMDDTDVFALKEKELAAFRNQKIGFIFQFHNLFPEFTALENVCMPAFIGGKSPEAVIKNRALPESKGSGKDRNLDGCQGRGRGSVPRRIAQCK